MENFDGLEILDQAAVTNQLPGTPYQAAVEGLGVLAKEAASGGAEPISDPDKSVAPEVEESNIVLGYN